MPEFRLPDIGEGLTEAEVVQWFVAVGDVVSVDQAIVEIETAKTVVEISSPFAGEISRLAAEAGDTVEVGDVLFVVGGADTPPESQPATEAPAVPPAPPSAKAPISDPATDDSPAVKAMPIIRKIARERGIDLATVTGTGPGGAVTRADLDNHESPTTADGELIALTPTRRAIAEHMAASWREIPHVTVQAEIRAEGLANARGGEDSRLSIEAVAGSRIIPLLREFPQFNAAFTDGGVLHRSDIHIGFAVDTEAGLMVVVVDNADSMSVEQLDAEFTRLANAAKNRTITADEVTGQTFTISNIGALGGGHGTPIIPLGTTAILSIGRANAAPVVVDGALDIGSVAPIDLSYDHRVIDGGLGQRFLSSVVTALES